MERQMDTDKEKGTDGKTKHTTDHKSVGQNK